MLSITYCFYCYYKINYNYLTKVKIDEMELSGKYIDLKVYDNIKWLIFEY
jgi:hypothetical protein